MIQEALPITLLINVLSLILIIARALPLGVISALKQNQLADRWHYPICVYRLCYSWLLARTNANVLDWCATRLATYFWPRKLWAMKICHGFHRQLDTLKHLILPVFISGVTGLAGISLFARNGMLEVLHQDYITTARSKGLSENRVVYGHALRNALLPLITILGLSIPGLIGGSVIAESIFAIPGMGKLFYDAVLMRDFPVIMGILTIGAPSLLKMRMT